MSVVTLHYKCRRCSQRFKTRSHDAPWAAEDELRARASKLATAITTHECNGDDSRELGVADLIGADR